MLKSILSEKDTYYNFLANPTRGTAWEGVNRLWFRVYAIQSSLEELESHLPSIEVNYINSSKIRKRAVERMFQILNDQTVDCNRALARLYLTQGPNGYLTASDTFDIVFQLGAIRYDTYCCFINGAEAFSDLVSVRNWAVHKQWKKPNDVLVYHSARRLIKAGRRYIEDIVEFLKVFSLKHFFELTTR